MLATAIRPDKVQTSQKRSHFRQECEIPATFKEIRKNDIKHFPLNKKHNARIINLSCGGARLATKTDLSKYDHIRLVFKIGDETIISVCEVRYKSRYSGANAHYQYGIMFTDFTARDEDAVCKYLFDNAQKYASRRQLR